MRRSIAMPPALMFARLIALRWVLQLLQKAIEVEALRFLSRRKVFESANKVRRNRLGSVQQKGLLQRPGVVRVRRDIRAFIWIHAQIVEFWQPPTRKRFSPDIEGAWGLLFAEDKLPISKAYRHELTVVIDVDEPLTIRVLLFPSQVRKLIISIEMYLVGPIADLPTGKQPVLDAGIAGRGQQGWEPVVPRKDVIRHGSWLDVTWPAHHRRHAESALPISVFFASEWRHSCIWP